MGLKIPWPHGRPGSSPGAGTKPSQGFRRTSLEKRRIIPSRRPSITRADRRQRFSLWTERALHQLSRVRGAQRPNCRQTPAYPGGVCAGGKARSSKMRIAVRGRDGGRAAGRPTTAPAGRGRRSTSLAGRLESGPPPRAERADEGLPFVPAARHAEGAGDGYRQFVSSRAAGRRIAEERRAPFAVPGRAVERHARPPPDGDPSVRAAVRASPAQGDLRLSGDRRPVYRDIADAPGDGAFGGGRFAIEIDGQRRRKHATWPRLGDVDPSRRRGLRPRPPPAETPGPALPAPGSPPVLAPAPPAVL